MAEQETLIQKHLRLYTKDSMTTKFRLDRTIEGYKSMDKKAQEGIIDEGDLLNTLKGRIPQNLKQIKTVEERKKKNEALRDEVQAYIKKDEAKAELLSTSIQEHLVELTELELARGGFIAHTVVHDNEVKNDEVTKILNFDKKAHAEYAISTNLDQWRDGSQLKINIRKTK